jgi:HD-GYP domain-containing protein (c-di-GMP phosphodiesterase class II)
MIKAEQWEELIKTGIVLSSYKDLDSLLEKIAIDTIRIVGCEGVSIYIRRQNHLDFMITHNTVLEKKLGDLKSVFRRFSMPISNQSISGYVAMTKEILNIDDVMKIEGKPFVFNSNLDKTHNYHTVSMLTLPMADNAGELIGVMQLVNSLDDNMVVDRFDTQDIFVAQYLSSIAAMAIKNTSFNEVLKRSYHETVERLATASEFRDLETSHHIKRMCEYSALLWKKLGCKNEEELENVKYASQMHDIGKLGIPDRILQKPGQLTEEERKIMEQHTIIGGKILEGSTSDLLQLSKTVAYSHHEKWNGTGYPFSLKKEEIPLIGRVVALADVFDALTSKRVYKPAFSVESVFKIIYEEKGKHFDPSIVDVFFSARGEILNIYNLYKE